MKGSCKRTKNSGGFNRCFSRFMVGRIMDCLKILNNLSTRRAECHGYVRGILFKRWSELN